MNPKCPRCGGPTRKNGLQPREGKWVQRYLCTKCARNFVEQNKKEGRK